MDRLRHMLTTRVDGVVAHGGQSSTSSTTFRAWAWTPFGSHPLLVGGKWAYPFTADPSYLRKHRSANTLSLCLPWILGYRPTRAQPPVRYRGRLARPRHCRPRQGDVHHGRHCHQQHPFSSRRRGSSPGSTRSRRIVLDQDGAVPPSMLD